MDAILDELKRIYGDPPAEWDPGILEDFGPSEVEWYRKLPAELRCIAEFIGYEEAFPHDQVRMLYGPADLIEWNSDGGTFGQLREIVPDYRFDKVIKIGDDTYLDVAGQVKQPGVVV